jgi:hypothetical protein
MSQIRCVFGLPGGPTVGNEAGKNRLTQNSVCRGLARDDATINLEVNEFEKVFLLLNRLARKTRLEGEAVV